MKKQLFIALTFTALTGITQQVSGMIKEEEEEFEDIRKEYHDMTGNAQNITSRVELIQRIDKDIKSGHTLDALYKKADDLSQKSKEFEAFSSQLEKETNPYSPYNIVRITVAGFINWLSGSNS